MYDHVPGVPRLTFAQVHPEAIKEVQEYDGLNRGQLLAINEASHSYSRHHSETFGDYYVIDYHLSHREYFEKLGRSPLCALCQENAQRLKDGLPFRFSRRVRFKGGWPFIDRPEDCELDPPRRPGEKNVQDRRKAERRRDVRPWNGYGWKSRRIGERRASK